jgi:hypothetical protein
MTAFSHHLIYGKRPLDGSGLTGNGAEVCAAYKQPITHLQNKTEQGQPRLIVLDLFLIQTAASLPYAAAIAEKIVVLTIRLRC